MRRFAFRVAVLGLLLFSGVDGVRGHTAAAAGGSTLARPEDPVVLTGADVTALTGMVPHDLVVFRYDGGWTQIPVQVDERDVRSFTTVYNGAVTSSVTELFYTDPNTWTGADSDATLDFNDEIAFMSKDAGGLPPSYSQPSNTLPGSGVQVVVTDPLAPSQQGWVYLFHSDGSLDPGAGQSYVNYTFSLNSGAYKTTYTLGDTHPALAGNPENSTISTLYYTYHFGDRWQEDQMTISAGGAANVDILDRHKPMFAPGNCARTEDTFDGYVNTFPIEGAFVANKSGPVRAIRSFVGANSGPRTQRDEIFYAQRQDIRTALRVHAIPSIMDFFDYNVAASGMTYFNDLNTGGVTIDGVPDVVTAGPLQWQMVTGSQGTVVMSGTVSTNIPAFAYTSYYLDKSAPGGGSETQCTGDGSAYGSSGLYVAAIPGPGPGTCTDPGLGCTDYLDTTSTLYYEAPSQTVATAQALNARANAPLTFAAGAWAPSVGGIAQAPDQAALPSVDRARTATRSEAGTAFSIVSGLLLAGLGIGRRLSRRSR